MSTKSSSSGKEPSNDEGYVKRAIKYESNDKKKVPFLNHV